MMQSGGEPGFGAGAAMPLHVPPGFQYYRIPHASLGACTPLSPTFMKEAAGGEGFVRENCILELRKEKSRDAARSRRGKENYEFYELAKMLPLPSAITSQLDKASIIRLTISYLKLREFSSHGDPSWNQNPPSSAKSIKGGHGRTRMTTIALEIFEQHQGTHILQSLDGFAFALAADGRFLYISETVSIYLGLSQVELTGSSIFDYIHQQDHVELAEQLGINLNQGRSIPSPTLVPSDDGPSSPAALMNVTNSVYEGLDRAFCIRMKSTLTKRGCHFKSSGYRVVLVLCHLRPQYSFSHSRKQPPTIMGMVALAIALPPPSVNEVRLESDMFVTRLTFDFKIAHCEPRVAELLDYTAEELTGKNMYALCHCEDLPKLRKCHIDLINKGQVMSSYYRAINKNAGYTWIQTCATVVSNSKNSEDRSIICVNYVLSGAEQEHCIMDCSQLGGHIQNLKPPDDPNNDFPESSSPDNDDKGDSDRRDGESSAGSPQHDDDGHSESSERLSQLSRQATVRPLVAPSHGIGSSDMKDTNGGPMPKDGRPAEPESSEGKVSSIPNARKRRRQQKDEVCRDGPEEEAEQMIATTTDRSLPRPVDEQSSAGDSTTDGNSSPSIAPRTLSPVDCDDGKDCDGRGSVASGDGSVGSSRGWKFSGSHESGGAGGGGSFVDDVTNSSVKELEDAMNKHLPIADKDTGDGSALNGGKQSRHQQRSTIQWIGPQHASPVAVGTSPLPASTLLRQLYANRESVIRSNVHASRPAFFPTDLQGTLATSPGGEGSFSDQTQFVLPPKLTAHSSHSSDSYAAAILSASYSPSSTLPGATYGDSYDASTPPSSSSPRDKLHPTGGGGGFPEGQGYGDVRHFSSSGADSSHLQPLPLKPQVYTVHPGAVPGLEPVPFSTHAQQTLSGDHAQQFYAHPHASGFHIYHPSVNKIPNAPASYVDNLKNGSGWYPPANS